MLGADVVGSAKMKMQRVQRVHVGERPAPDVQQIVGRCGGRLQRQMAGAGQRIAGRVQRERVQIVADRCAELQRIGETHRAALQVEQCVRALLGQRRTEEIGALQLAVQSAGTAQLLLATVAGRVAVRRVRRRIRVIVDFEHDRVAVVLDGSTYLPGSGSG